MKKYGKWILTALTVLWAFVIWQFSLAPAAASSETSGEVLGLYQRLLEKLPFLPVLTGGTVRKMAHFAEFFVLGVLSVCTFTAHGFSHRTLLTVAAVALVATVDETIQAFVPGRGPHVLDVLLDTAGGVCGLLVFLTAVALLAYIKGKESKKAE